MKSLNALIIAGLAIFAANCGPAASPELETSTMPIDATAEVMVEPIDLSSEDLTLLSELESDSGNVAKKVEVTRENYKALLAELERELGSEN